MRAGGVSARMKGACVVPVNAPPNTTSEIATLLSREHLFSLVLEPAPKIAVFDCDGTLWWMDAGSGFMHWSIETGLVSREMADWMDVRYRGYLRGEVSEAAICGEMVQLYQGLREDELRQAARVFAEREVAPKIFLEMQELVRQLQARGTEIWAVSSTARWVIEEALRSFAIDARRVLAARVRVRDGVLTNDLEAVPTDEAKAAELRRVGVERPDAVFGNSIHDAAMLRMAKRAFAINPTQALRDEATRQHWPVFQP